MKVIKNLQLFISVFEAFLQHIKSHVRLYNFCSGSKNIFSNLFTSMFMLMKLFKLDKLLFTQFLTRLRSYNGDNACKMHFFILIALLRVCWN